MNIYLIGFSLFFVGYFSVIGLIFIVFSLIIGFPINLLEWVYTIFIISLIGGISGIILSYIMMYE